MVKIKSPLMSHSASGKIHGNIIFSLRGSGQQVRLQRPPIDRKSVTQIAERGLYLVAVSEWVALPLEDKRAYARQAIDLQMTGYNLFIKNYILENGPSSHSAIYGVGIYGMAIYGQN